MDGVTYPCDGQGAGSNPGLPPGNCPVDALDGVSKLLGFTYNGSFDGEFNDWAVNRIGKTENYLSGPDDYSYYHYWVLLVNYKESQFGLGLTLSGCQQLLNPGDDVLWAFITDGPSGIGLRPQLPAFLKLEPKKVTVKKGKGFTVTVTDGLSGNATKDAVVHGVKTDAKGKATLRFSHTGFFQFKAHRGNDTRSNVMNVTVTD